MGDLLTERYANEIKGTLTCFDRLVFFGSFQEIAYSDVSGRIKTVYGYADDSSYYN